MSVALVTALLVSCAEDVRIDRAVPYGPDPAQVADVYLPEDDRTDRPAVVLVHGGGWAQGTRTDVARNARELAESGIAAFAIDYRLPPAGQRWPAELEDVQTAVRWVQQNATRFGVDPRRLGLYGSSAGGHLAMMVGTVGQGDPTLPPVRAVVSWSGPADLTSLTPPDGVADPADPPPGCGEVTLCIGVIDPGTLTSLLGCTPRQCPERYAEASPTTRVSRDSPPMFLAAAEEDFVPYEQVRRMQAALEADGVEVRTREVPGTGHAESLRADLLRPTIRFFRNNL